VYRHKSPTEVTLLPLLRRGTSLHETHYGHFRTHAAATRFWELADIYLVTAVRGNGLRRLIKHSNLRGRVRCRTAQTERGVAAARGALRISRRADAAQWFHEAIGVARRQSAKSWELRATISLARLLEKLGCSEEAPTNLAEKDSIRGCDEIERLLALPPRALPHLAPLPVKSRLASPVGPLRCGTPVLNFGLDALQTRCCARKRKFTISLSHWY
jgi:hypothetical protein